MQLSEASSEVAAQEIVRLWSAQAEGRDNVQVVICPSPSSLGLVSKILKGTNVALGAQDVFWEDKGAFTGEISPVTLKEFGVEYCIVGHSERRQHLGETNEMVQKKVAALLKHNITPVICVGEVQTERDEGRHTAVVTEQVRKALEGNTLVGAQKIIIAYEPRWAIGTGLACSPDDAAEIVHVIRNTMYEVYSADIVDRQCAIVYGGSANDENMGEYAAVEIIDGALVGGASLKPEVFVRMAELLADESPR